MTDLFVLARSGQLADFDAESLRAARDRHGGGLLHARLQPETLRHLLLAGLDPNGRDRRGLTPLMCQQHLECNRLLLEAGADLHATDLQGNSVLAYQAGALDGCCGYLAPDFAVLDALLEAGAALPTDQQLEQWIADALARVSAGVEYNDARRFEGWARQLMTGRDQPRA
jgi:ankyrin repeat protein